MPTPRPLTDAAVLKQLKAIGEKLSAKKMGKQRLDLLRRQAALGDQRDEAATKARRSEDGSRPDR
ncbi:MAG: hypothetical protein JWM71_1230 [Solirubrobacteraceae bacterium]|nr:hypothetical protein [Solirubrobacteraceae bacterium]